MRNWTNLTGEVLAISGVAQGPADVAIRIGATERHAADDSVRPTVAASPVHRGPAA